MRLLNAPRIVALGILAALASGCSDSPTENCPPPTTTQATSRADLDQAELLAVPKCALQRPAN